jgi:uncharacterized repeat protein (TIGR03806 family)
VKSDFRSSFRLRSSRWASAFWQRALVPLTASLWLLCMPKAAAVLQHRWSFNQPADSSLAGTVFPDGVSGLTMTLKGQGATLDGNRIVLPGTTGCDRPDSTISAYLDLPNGLISSKTHLTLEFWAAPLGARFWSPLFDFGRMNTAGDGMGAPGEWTGTTATGPANTQTGDGLGMTLSREMDPNAQRVGITLDTERTDLDSDLPTTLGQVYHYVVTVEDGTGMHGASGMRVSAYRDGVLIGSRDLAYRLASIEDVNNWLGRSQWATLSTSNVAYDEVRIYNHAFTPAEVAASRTAGPNAAFGPPQTHPDAGTLHHAQKIRIRVLATDLGGIDPASVQIVQPPHSGTATPDSSGSILYHHTTGTPATEFFSYRVNGPGGLSPPATVTLTFATSLRIANGALNVPAAPPVTTFRLVPAFPGVTIQEPICVASPPGNTSQIYVVERRRGVRVIPDVTAVTPTSPIFFDVATYLTSRGEALGNTFDQGVMGLAFHPNYATNRHFFVFYSVRTAGLEYFRVSRFTAQAGNPLTVDFASERVLIQQRDVNGYHLGTDLHFCPDGYLYVSLGDGGGQHDSRGNGQRINGDFFAAILRLDVNKVPGNPEPNVHPSVPTDAGLARYSVPADNPFVTGSATVPFNGQNLPSASVRTEFWATGFRNPWKFSFDSHTGELWCADVGQEGVEEINIVTRGGNFGWSFREGTRPGPRVLQQPAGFVGTPPLYEYTRGDGPLEGRSVSGGLVYRGVRLPSLTGAYIFGDFQSGHIWALRRTTNGVDVHRLTGETGIVSFGTDPSNGDVLAVDNNGARILRLTTGGTDANSFPQTLTETELFSDLTDLSPAPGLLPYTPNLSFWSDYAAKRRWFIVPNAASHLTWARDSTWTFPDGTIWVKHFDMEMTRGQPATSRRIETRLLVKNAAGSYGVSYRWNAAQSEALLVADQGENFTLEITEDGVQRTQNYRIPSRAECLACHTPQAGHSLSFDTRQLNRAESIHGFAGNQIDLLRHAGYFTNTPEPVNLLPRHIRPDETQFSIEARVRSYLAVNCANCHRAGGTATASWDGRPDLALAHTGLINGLATNSGTDPANRLIVPADTAHSIVLHRMAATNGFSRMPPLGSSELDQRGIALLTEWISQALPAQQTYAQWRVVQFGSATSAVGEPDADADDDGQMNRGEFLAGTDPLHGGSSFIPRVALLGPNVTLQFTSPGNRSIQIETSSDLTGWSLWDVPGNHGMPLFGGPTSITGPCIGDRQFFRLLLKEN